MSKKEVGPAPAVTAQPKIIITTKVPGTAAAGTAGQPSVSWQTGLTDCCADTKICLCGGFCPCVLACQLAEQNGECFCLPLLDGSMLALRTGMRARYNIQGSVCSDWVALSFCTACALCQMAREMKHQRAKASEIQYLKQSARELC
uniref:Cornifelin n=2 Tax=Lepisosteus oculatus TaxID=7918 RepID=W5M7B9_LEPOC